MSSTRRVSSLFTPKNSRYHFYISTAAFATGVGVIVAVVAFGVYMASGGAGRGSLAEAESPFCCPDQAQVILRYLNTSVAPCANFYDYVCSAVVAGSLRRRTSVNNQLVEIMITGVLPNGLQRRKGASFLIAYHKSCVEAVMSAPLFLSSVAGALVKNEKALLNNMDAKQALVFCMVAATKYYLPSAIFAFFDARAKAVFLKVNVICNQTRMSRGALSASVYEINEAFNATVTEEIVQALAFTICNNISIADDEIVSLYTLDNSEEFQREVWCMDHLEAALATIGYALRDTIVLNVTGSRNIRLIHEIISEPLLDDASSVKAAYFLWHSLNTALGQFYISNNDSPMRVFTTCKDSAQSMVELWRRFTAEIFSTAQKDARATALFQAVKEAVQVDSRASSLFGPADLTRLDAFFDNVTLLTPTADIHSGVTPPEPTESFGDNFLGGRLYELGVARRNVQGENELWPRYNGVYFIGQNRLLLAANVYRDITASASDSKLPGMAVLGWILSEALWLKLLYGIGWTPGTVANIGHLTSCHKSVLDSIGANGSRGETLAVAALGLRSARNAFPHTDWLKTKKAWSTWRLSHGMFFYILSTYVRCFDRSAPEQADLTNAALMQFGDFADVFTCAPDSAMKSIRSCRFPPKRVKNYGDVQDDQTF